MSDVYLGLLKKAAPELKREALKHERQWHGAFDKLEKGYDH